MCLPWVIVCHILLIFNSGVIAVEPGDCPLPGDIENGNVHLEDKNSKVGDAVKYTCNESYTMMGSRTRHCLSNGKWSGEAPTCEKLCSFPHTMPHVRIKVNPYLLGTPLRDTNDNEVLSELEFSCDPSYNLVGSKRIRCASGVWDQPPATCELDIRCTNPGAPENGQCLDKHCVQDDFLPGRQLKFRCHDGYTLVGTSTVTCMPAGFWSASIPTCLPKVVSQCKCTCQSPAEVQQALQYLGKSLACITDTSTIASFNESEYIVLVPDI